jgi:hypothetical protein
VEVKAPVCYTNFMKRDEAISLLIPVQAAHQNGMMPPAVTE